MEEVRTELDEPVSGGIDLLNCISIAQRNVTAKPAIAKPFLNQRSHPENRKSSKGMGSFRHFMSDLQMIT